MDVKLKVYNTIPEHLAFIKNDVNIEGEYFIDPTSRSLAIIQKNANEQELTERADKAFSKLYESLTKLNDSELLKAIARSYILGITSICANTIDENLIIIILAGGVLSYTYNMIPFERNVILAKSDKLPLLYEIQEKFSELLEEEIKTLFNNYNDETNTVNFLDNQLHVTVRKEGTDLVATSKDQEGNLVFGKVVHLG